MCIFEFPSLVCSGSNKRIFQGVGVINCIIGVYSSRLNIYKVYNLGFWVAAGPIGYL